ncbi:MAG: histidine kinase N-terminal 7TM domain-containing protein, partial [Halobacteriaceae archaeon]
QLFWQQVGLAIGGTIPTVWFLFTLQYAGRGGWLTPVKRAGLAIDPLLFALLSLTNPVHELIWTTATLIPTQGGPVLQLTFAIGYYIHIMYAYLIVVSGLGLLLFMFERTAPVYQRQTGFLILGALPPFAANIAYTLRVSWGPLPAVDPTPFVFVLTGLVWALGLYQFDLLER